MVPDFKFREGAAAFASSALACRHRIALTPIARPKPQPTFLPTEAVSAGPEMGSDLLDAPESDAVVGRNKSRQCLSHGLDLP